MNTTSKNYRWRILALLFFATTINYIDRQVIGILKPFIAKDLGWDEADYGYIVTAFHIAYALGLLTTGRLLDRFGVRIGYLWAVFSWSLAGMAHAAASGVGSFAIARFALGIGESANFPAAIKSVAEWFPKKDRAYATGLFNTGATVGAVIAPIMVSAITLSMGWQWAFIITGALGFIWVVCWKLYYQVPEKHPKVSKAELDYIHQDENGHTPEIRLAWIDLFKHKETIALCSCRFATDWVWWFLLFWVPDFLSKMYNVNIKEVVFPLILIYTVSSAGGIGGGWLSSKFIEMGKGIDFSRKTTILICAILVLPLVLVSSVSNLWVSVGLLALAAAGHQGYAANIFTIVSDIYPKNAVASMVGLSGFSGAIGGALSASFVGLLLEATGSYFAIFFTAALAYFTCWLILVLFIKEIKPITV